MAKKETRDTELTGLEQAWSGTDPSTGREWGVKKERIEAFLKKKLRDHDTTLSSQEDAINRYEAKIAGAVTGVSVNNEDAARDGSGRVMINVPRVSTDVLNPQNADAAQAGAVAEELNAQKSQPFGDVRLGSPSEDGTMVALEFYARDNDEEPFASVNVPAAQEIGETVVPRVSTELLCPQTVKLGDSISVRWTYDCIRKVDGVSERVAIDALQVEIVAKLGATEIYRETRPMVSPGTSGTVTLGPSQVSSAGTVSVSVSATVNIGEEAKTSRGSKSVSVITMALGTTYDPSQQLSLSGGYTDGQTVSIPYTYTVPAGTTLRVWLDGIETMTQSISGTGRNYLSLQASSLAAGRHNVQLIAEKDGLLSDAVIVDLLKAGSSDGYLGLRYSVGVSQLTQMPLAFASGGASVALSTEQFGELSMDFAAWQPTSIDSVVRVSVDGGVTQELIADRSLQSLVQRFDTAGEHEFVVSVVVGGTSTAHRTFTVAVGSAADITETEASGYRTKLIADGRTNSESNPSDWGGITSFSGVDWRTTGWQRGSDGIDALLLRNGARAVIGIMPFVQDLQDGDYSIESRGMTLEMELQLSQVLERGGTVVSCLWDNDGQGYPMGLKVTTEEAGVYFGGVEQIKTAEDALDEQGNTIEDLNEPDGKRKLYITRAKGAAMNIALDRWMKLTWVIEPVSGGRGIAMLYINGVLSRANTYTGSLRQTVPQGITIDSDKADVRVRSLRYYRTPLRADEVLGNWVIDRPSGTGIRTEHDLNAVGDLNSSTDSDGNIGISRETLLSLGRGVLTIIRSDDSGSGLTDLFSGPHSADKKWNFKADLVRWEPPLDAEGRKIGEGFEARNVRIRIQGTSSVKYPYKNIRIYLTTAQDGERSLTVGGTDVTSTAKGYALRGAADSIEQSVLCAKTDFVDSSLTMNTGGAHLFDKVMRSLHLTTPPQDYDSRVRQAIDGLPCDVFGGKSESGQLEYLGQFVLNNEKSKSGGIFGMEGVDGFSGDTELNPLSLALEALTNSSPMTLFQPAGSADSAELDTQLSSQFDDGFEFNFPEDATWSNVDEGQWDTEKNKWAVKPVPGARAAIKRWLGWIWDCVPESMRTSPDYGTQEGWSDVSKAKWTSQKFRDEASQYFNIDHLLTYYLITDYWASVDQRAKNILWRTWDGKKWYATYYDGDTAMSIRNDAFMVYLYDVTRDTYDHERSKYAFEGHSSWLWCLVLANFEEELKSAASRLRGQLQTQVMLNEFNGEMQGNWSARQYNKSQKLKYIDTIATLNYVYTLTGNRELHRTQFLRDRARLLDARYNCGEYDGDNVTLTVVRQESDAPSSLRVTSGDLYYYGYKLNGRWLEGPLKASAGDTVTLTFRDTLATNDPLMLGGASCIRELDLTGMGSQLNGAVGLSLCKMLTRLVMPATNGVANAPLNLGNTSKLEYVDLTGQTSVHTGTAGVFDLSQHTRLSTLLAGGTGLTRIVLPEGSPLTRLVVPSTLTTLTLRYLPRLTSRGLTIEGAENIRQLNFAYCPRLSWQWLLDECPNIDHVRIEGMSGRVMSSELRRFMTGYRGLSASGTEQTYPALLGKVQLIDPVDDYAELRDWAALCGLTVEACEFSHYEFNDEETDPANIGNADAGLGYGYDTAYTAKGHIVKLHEKSQVCGGYINPDTGLMRVIPLSKESLSQRKGGGTFNPANEKYDNQDVDVFLYLPRYWYKGVNDYKRGKKHFYLSANDTCPSATGTTVRQRLAAVLTEQNRAVDADSARIGQPFGGVTVASGYAVGRVDVEDMRQVRFPSVDHSRYGCVFVDSEGVVLSSWHLQMDDVLNSDHTEVVNPADFDAELGDYDFRDVPDGAKWLLFTCLDGLSGDEEVIATDSWETEAIEPDWVEHKAELIGLYQGWASSDRASMAVGNTNAVGNYHLTGMLRSLSGKITLRGSKNPAAVANTADWSYDAAGNPQALPSGACSGTAQDFYNLARVRNVLQGVREGEFTTVGYETSKDMANLLMIWFGTRDVESVVGAGGTPAYTTGTRNVLAYADSDRETMGAASDKNANQLNKMWGLEGWTGSMYEWTDKGCVNAPSFASFLAAKRIAQASWTADNYYNIVQQDGSERRVKVSTERPDTGVARVRHGRYCDIIASAFTGDTTYALCYCCYQGSGGTDLGRVLGRSYSSADAAAGVAHSGTGHVSAYSHANSGARLCFFGKIENEEELLE